jgi:hypothetical protein
MISANTVLAALLLSAVSGVYAANDWNVPCNTGKCEYDVAGSDKSIAANVRIVRSVFVTLHEATQRTDNHFNCSLVVGL